MLFGVMNKVEEIKYIKKLHEELSKEDQISESRRELLIVLGGNKFWKSFAYNISKGKISDENLKTITNHMDEHDRLSLLKEFCKIEGFTDFIKQKIQKIQSALAAKINASGVFDKKHIKKSLENILSITEPKKKNAEENQEIIKKQDTKKVSAKFNGNQKHTKNNNKK